MKLFLLLLLWPLASPAATEGKFTGPGTSLTHRSGTRRVCSEIFLHIERSEKDFKVLEGGYRCGNLEASFDPFTLEIRDGRIYAEGEDVGTITGNRLDLFFANRAEDFTYHWQLDFGAGGIEYLEEWTDGGKPALTIEGKLSPLSGTNR